MATNYQPTDLLTERLHLKPVSSRDATALFSFFSDPSCLKNTTQELCQSLRQAESVLFQMLCGGGRWWFICVDPDFKVVGLIGYNQFRVPQIGFTVKPDQRCQGYCSEALKSILEYGHFVEGINKYEALTHPLNHPTIKILEKHNFSCYGSVWQYYPNEGKVVGSKVYGLYIEDRGSAGLPANSCEMVILLPSKSIDRSLVFYQNIGFAVDFVEGSPPHYAGVSLGMWSSAKARIHFAQNKQIGGQSSLVVYLIVGRAIEAIYKLCQEASAPISQELEHITCSMLQFTTQDPDDHYLIFRNYL